MAKLAVVGVLAAAALAVAVPPVTAAPSPTEAADTQRTGWYGDERGLSPQAVEASTFDRSFATPVNGTVQAQPLVWDGVLLVATEENSIYGLDPITGAVKWQRSVGTPFTSNELGCADPVPHTGITGTPTIDPATNTAYFAAKSNDSSNPPKTSWYLHAINVVDGSEQPHFPVLLSTPTGADNAPSVNFAPKTQLQRPGLLLVGGKVYVAFGSTCDILPWHGWVFGVDGTSDPNAGQTTARWVTSPNGDGGGIWQSGGGLVSDAPGQILLTTGNGQPPSSPAIGHSPPSTLGDSMVRLQVQNDGTLQASDFFAPVDAVTQDPNDGDFGSTGPLALPQQYLPGPSGQPMIFAGDKEGDAFLLDATNLGGFEQGPGGGDAVVQDQSTNSGGVWAHPAVWPGDGGWVYMPTGSPASDPLHPEFWPNSGNLEFFGYQSASHTLAAPILSAEFYGLGSGAPVVTSDGTTSGSALLWLTQRNNDPSTPDAGQCQLRVYAAMPINGVPQLVRSFPVGVCSKFTPAGIAGDRVYVSGLAGGTTYVLGYAVTAPFSGSSVSFAPTQVGQSSAATATLTANQNLSIASVQVIAGPFAIAGAPSTSNPTFGTQVTIPLGFTPTASGDAAGTLRVTASNGGVLDLGLAGSGTSAPVVLPPPGPKPLAPGPGPKPFAQASFIPRGRIVLAAANRIKIRVHCGAAGGRCRGTLVLRIRLRGHLVTVGSARFTIAPGQTARIALRVSRSVLRRVRPQHSVTGVAILQWSDAGRQQQQAIALVFRAPSSRHRRG